jgi:hypothetical protein
LSAGFLTAARRGAGVGGDLILLPLPEPEQRLGHHLVGAVKLATLKLLADEFLDVGVKEMCISTLLGLDASTARRCCHPDSRV